jgi:peroxiredoxin (alkyl hydroperoxide reductase subunit C)
MSVLPAGTPAPDFTLKTEEGESFTRADLFGTPTILVFYPFAFSPVCTDQLQIYEEVLGDIEAQGARIFGVSTDASYAQKAFRESLNVTIPQLSDFEPKGEASRAFGAFFEPGGMTNRALVVTDADGVVAWSWEGENPGVLPGANLLFDGLAAVGASA